MLPPLPLAVPIVLNGLLSPAKKLWVVGIRRTPARMSNTLSARWYMEKPSTAVLSSIHAALSIETATMVSPGLTATNAEVLFGTVVHGLAKVRVVVVAELMLRICPAPVPPTSSTKPPLYALPKLALLAVSEVAVALVTDPSASPRKSTIGREPVLPLRAWLRQKMRVGTDGPRKVSVRFESGAGAPSSL